MNHSKTDQILEAIRTPITRWHQPILLATFGLPGAGKTSVSTLVEQHFPLIVLSTAALRLTYGFSSGPTTLEAMQQVAKQLLAERRSVLFDGIHMMRSSRNELRTFGALCQAFVRFVYVTAHPEVMTERLEERLKDPDKTTSHGKFVITAEHFARIAQHVEAPLEEIDVTQVDTSLGQASVAAQLQPLFDELQAFL